MWSRTIRSISHRTSKNPPHSYLCLRLSPPPPLDPKCFTSIRRMQSAALHVAQASCDYSIPTVHPSHTSTAPIVQVSFSRRELTQRSRTAASQIRLAIQQCRTAEAVHIHDTIIQAGLASGYATSGRLVTTALIHTLLRAGRRFKAAQIAETAWLGSASKSSASFLDGLCNISPHEPLRLSYKTSEAIIMSLCPPPLQTADLQRNPPWKLFADEHDNGPAARRGEQTGRNLLAIEELQVEGALRARDESYGYLPSVTPRSHEAHVQSILRSQLETSDDPNVRQDLLGDRAPKLDKATQRALLFVQVLRSSRQRRTSKMFEALVDACLLQGEIIVGTLLFVLLVRDWQARKLLQNTPAEKDQANPNRIGGDHSQGWSRTIQSDESRDMGWPKDISRQAHNLTLQGAAENGLDVAGLRISLQDARKKPPEDPPDRKLVMHKQLIIDKTKAIRYGLDVDLDPGSNFIPNPHSISSRHIVDSIVSTAGNLMYASDQRHGHGITALKQLIYLVNDGALCPAPTSLIRAITNLPNGPYVRKGEVTLDRPKVSALHAFHHYPYPPSSNATDVDSSHRLPISMGQLSEQGVKAAVAHCTTSAKLSREDLHALIEATYTVLGSHKHATQVLEVMKNLDYNIDHPDTLAILIKGALAIRNFELVETVLNRIKELYEAGDDSFDPRVLLLIYGTDNWGGRRVVHGKAMALYEDLRKQLADRGSRVERLIPMGEPTLLNAIMSYLLTPRRNSATRHLIIGFNLDLLLPFSRVGPGYNVSGALSLAASMGPEFYQHLLNALAGVGDSSVPSSFLERVWRIAKRAELQSWRLEMRRLHSEYLGSQDEQTTPQLVGVDTSTSLSSSRSLAWVLGPDAYTMMMENYVVDQTRKRQTLEWRDAFPMNAKEMSPRGRWEGYRQPYDVPLADLSWERSQEVHESLMEISTPGRVEETLRELWERYEQQDGVVGPQVMELVHGGRWRSYRRPRRPAIRPPDRRYFESVLRLWGTKEMVLTRDPGLGRDLGTLTSGDGLGQEVRILSEDAVRYGWSIVKSTVRTTDRSTRLQDRRTRPEVRLRGSGALKD
ncbi:hypothetical protein FRB95_011974 [Tulasnella sp. JGI-2019a]|nr:hypothetical protein FRB95_011974 [Tulasnella sp. JGI-2019a]